MDVHNGTFYGNRTGLPFHFDSIPGILTCHLYRTCCWAPVRMHRLTGVKLPQSERGVAKNHSARPGTYRIRTTMAWDFAHGLFRQGKLGSSLLT